MANLTISVDSDALKRARIRALKENTSVNAILGRYLEDYARLDEVRRERKRAVERLLNFATEHPIDWGRHRWNREDLYDR
ncbi:MAG: hypothetical protein GY807_23360 [Gammaproteobacteria bacterium]|nr:hypothetical protein [Gammaproteobacteria bacterium]